MEVFRDVLHGVNLDPRAEMEFNREHGCGQFFTRLTTDEWQVQHDDRLLGYQDVQDIYEFTGRTQLDLSKISVEGLFAGLRLDSRQHESEPTMLLERARLHISDTETFWRGFIHWPIVENSALVAVRLENVLGGVSLRRLVQPYNLSEAC